MTTLEAKEYLRKKLKNRISKRKLEEDLNSMAPCEFDIRWLDWKINLLSQCEKNERKERK